MKSSKSCQQCGGNMIEGRLLTSDSYDSRKVPDWLEGVPEKSVWTGIKTKGRVVLPVVSYRCAQCGLLQSYAQ